MRISKVHPKFDDFDEELLKEHIRKNNNGTLDKEKFEFAKKLCTEMMKQKKTNTDIVKLTGISKTSMTYYTNGDRIPSPKQLKQIANALMVPTDYLLGKTNAKTLSGMEVEEMLGITENFMRVLYGLNHNVEEFGDLQDKIERSNVHKDKLDIFCLLAEDVSKFRELLLYFERYVKVSQELENTDFESGLNTKSKEELQDYLIRN
ncbi:MAG: helix-turn-helix transcriptional regulator [Clostridia bacterium]|nr:helix-turn-helix transcriptional regulator [Clostridia bacterium]